MSTENKSFQKEHKTFRGTPFILIVVLLAILAVISENYFSFLERQLFEERKSHIVEFTDKASEVVESVIDYTWQQVLACEHVLRINEITSQEELLETLASTSSFLDREASLVLAIDQNAGYYSSDSFTGHWPLTEYLASGSGQQQLIVAEIPHKPEYSYFVFIERLESPVAIGGSDQLITHLMVAVDIETLRDKISVNGFGDQCYTYLVNKDGRRLYKYTYANNFIESYNVLRSFQDYKILHGESYPEFIQTLEQDRNTALEFEFVSSDGRKENWFVANAAVAPADLQILLFVPTQVLGENTIVLLNRTIRFFVAAIVVILVLTAVIIVIAMISKADKQLVKQKDEANQLLMTAADEANSANQAKSDFLSNMSHDIRTPINGIMGMTDIALKNIGNQEKVLDCLQKISGSSQHLLGLINDVLDMSRIESGKTKVNHESFNLKTCIDNCASIIGGQLVTRNIELITEFNDFEHPLLVGDELHLRQVFINILGNSVKFTPDGGKIRFLAREKAQTEERALFRFELSDTGIGMKAEFLPHLFEPFAQEDNGTRTTYKGTGLGMAITKQFVDLMGGTIKVESKLNEGTKFTIEIWIDIDKEAKLSEPQTELQVNLTGMKVLLVEDIELNMEIARTILESEGAVVTPAVNGQEAVDAFADNPPGTFDVIIMDIMMPVMDGITATKIIRAMERPDAGTIPILALTANAYSEDIRSTQEAGMNAHLSKPIDVPVFYKVLSHFYSAEENEAPQSLREIKGLRVLLVDDTDLNLEIAQTILEEEGAVVTSAQNGQEAVDIFCGNPPDTFDVILMDVHMPVMDGITAARTIRALDREDARKIQILAMTADVYDEDIQRTKEAGMDGHLAKPLDIEKMLWLLSGYKED